MLRDFQIAVRNQHIQIKRFVAHIGFVVGRQRPSKMTPNSNAATITADSIPISVRLKFIGSLLTLMQAVREKPTYRIDKKGVPAKYPPRQRSPSCVWKCCMETLRT